MTLADAPGTRVRNTKAVMAIISNRSLAGPVTLFFLQKKLGAAPVTLDPRTTRTTGATPVKHERSIYAVRRNVNTIVGACLIGSVANSERTNTAGTVNDLPGPPGVAGFFAFPTAPTLHFTLTQLGPGVANTTCAGLAIGQSCSVFPGSPFILTATATGTAVTLDASGIATDASPFTSNWTGAFTTQIPGVSAASIQATINAGGAITSTFSGEFVAGVPEPLTSALIGGGLVALAAFKRRKVAQSSPRSKSAFEPHSL
jgi:hypothetical protein